MSGSDWCELVVLPGVGLAVMVIVWRLGYLRASALDAAPRRRVGLGALDLAMSFAVMFLGMVAVHMVASRLGMSVGGEQVSGEAGQGVGELDAGQYLMRVLLDQGLAKLPVVLFVLWRCSAWRGGLNELGVGMRKPVRDALAGVVGLAAALPMAMGLSVVVVFVGELTGHPQPEIGHDMLAVLQQASSLWVTVGLFVSAVVAAPVLEEVIFRGLVQTALVGMFGWGHRWIALIAASVVFAGVHTNQPWQVLPSLFVLAMVMGWLYERTGSLWPSVIVHAGFNAVNVALAMGWWQ